MDLAELVRQLCGHNFNKSVIFTLLGGVDLTLQTIGEDAGNVILVLAPMPNSEELKKEQWD